MQAATKAATRTGANKAAAQGFNPIKNPFVEGVDGRLQLRANPDGTTGAPNLQFWDAVKQNLDDKVSSLYRSGEKGQARDIATLRDTLRDHLDQAVPAYQQARAGAASFFGAQDALEAGQNFTKKNVDIRAAQNAVNKMSNPEKQLFAEGFTDSLIRTVEQAPDRANVVRKIYGSQDAKNRIRVALGPQRANDLEAFLRTEATIDLVRPAVQGNSKTVQRLAELGIAGGGGVGYGLLTGDHSPGDMFSAAVLTAAAKRGGVALNARVVRRLAEMLVSSDPTVYLRGVKTAARNKAFMGALRQIGAPAGSVAAQQGNPTGKFLPHAVQ